MKNSLIPLGDFPREDRFLADASTLLMDLWREDRLFFEGEQAIVPYSSEEIESAARLLKVSEVSLTLATSANRPSRKSELYDERFTASLEPREVRFLRLKRTPDR